MLQAPFDLYSTSQAMWTGGGHARTEHGVTGFDVHRLLGDSPAEVARVGGKCVS
jgi:hypothetical protein